MERRESGWDLLHIALVDWSHIAIILLLLTVQGDSGCQKGANSG